MQMAAVPRQGWQTRLFYSSPYFHLGLAISLLLTLFTGLRARHNHQLHERNTALVGAGLGCNQHRPAQVFMGDVGALALGAALGTIAVIVRQEIVLFIMKAVPGHGDPVGGDPSRLLQVDRQVLHGADPSPLWFRKAGRPRGRFWIITVILVLIGLATLKLR